MLLQSRSAFTSSQQFRDAFLNTLTPGIISRDHFIQWGKIDEKIVNLQEAVNFYKGLEQFVGTNNFSTELKNGLLSTDHPAAIIFAGFQLLAHTGGTFVSDRDYLHFNELDPNEISEEKAEYYSILLHDLGIERVISDNIDDYFLGVQVGLETHRRKNIGGETFKELVGNELERIKAELLEENINCSLESEYTIDHQNWAAQKRVDYFFVIEDVKLGIEVNFYTSSGSKPTEIKRSYGLVNQELERVGVTLVWVTDGAGYHVMKKSLMDAWDIHKNTYNLSMLKEHLKNDLLLTIA